jgi:hypothetical protein
MSTVCSNRKDVTNGMKQVGKQQYSEVAIEESVLEPRADQLSLVSGTVYSDWLMVRLSSVAQVLSLTV